MSSKNYLACRPITLDLWHSRSAAERLRLSGVCGSSRAADPMGLRATGSSPVSAFAGPHLGKALPSADHAGSGAKHSSVGLGVLTRVLTLVCDDAGNLRRWRPPETWPFAADRDSLSGVADGNV
jgi:hypothetical protein